MSDELKMFGTYKVEALDSDGNVIQENTIESTGSFTIEEIKTNALLHDLAELKVTPLEVKTERDGKTEMKIEADF